MEAKVLRLLERSWQNCLVLFLQQVQVSVSANMEQLGFFTLSSILQVGRKRTDSRHFWVEINILGS